MITFSLLKPHILAYKNRLLIRREKGWFNRESLALIMSLVLALSMYWVNGAFVESLRAHPSYRPEILQNLLRMFLFGFFSLLAFSNIIVALSSLFMSQELPLLLTAPVSMPSLFFAKLIEVVITSSWIFLLFAVPVAAACAEALDLGPGFVVTALLSLIPFLLIPGAIAILLITLFVNVIPPHRMRDLLVVVAFFLSCGLLFYGHDSPEIFPSEHRKMNELISYLDRFQDPQPVWLPSRWVADLLGPYFGGPSEDPLILWITLLSSAAAAIALSFLVFERFFLRGLSVAAQGSKHARIYSSDATALLGRLLVPWGSQFRAIFYKEARMFIRDTTQALQLMMLLLLTFMYLYNFRTLRTASQFSAEGIVWWQVILSVANVAFGACVVAAIATRFVFPSVSLEGRAYPLLRSTPLSIEQLLRYKYFTWLGPIMVLSIVLLVSGTFAIQGTLETIAATTAVAIALSVGITGLGIGAGGYYARFDWESPAQVTASFGSLVYMLLSLTNIMLSLIPIFFLFILTCIPDFAQQMSNRDYSLALFGSLALLMLINVFSTKQALSAGANALKDLGR